MDNRETLTPSSGDAILKRHLFSEVARNWIKGRGHIERAYFVRRPSRQSFGFRVAASSGPIPKAPGSAGGYLPGRRPGRRMRRERWKPCITSEELRGLLLSRPFGIHGDGSHVIVACRAEGPRACRVRISGLAQSWLRPVPRPRGSTSTWAPRPLC